MIPAILAIVILGALLAYREYVHYSERESHKAEREQLYQRIQAPQMAVMEHHQPEQERTYIGFDNDDEYWAAEEERKAAIDG